MKRLFGWSLVVIALQVTPMFGSDRSKRWSDDEIREIKALAAQIDKHLEAEWKKKGIKPTDRVGDGQYVRRVFLDLAGRIPHVNEVIDFLDSEAKVEDLGMDKRFLLVEALLTGNWRGNLVGYEPQNPDDYVEHYTNTWRQIMMPTQNTQFGANYSYQFAPWINQRVKDNVGFDKMFTDLMRGSVDRNNMYAQGSAASFFQAYENKPENIASATARIFLGVKLECAQCHDDRSGGKWKKEQFWQYAAFFSASQLFDPNTGQPIKAGDGRSIKIAGSEKVVDAKFLDDSAPEWKDGDDPRAVLAKWILRKENPYFARTLANRLWHQMFGIGIVDPVDEFNENNKPSHPELLEVLVEALVKHKYNVKILLAAMATSKAYQLSSATEEPHDIRLFARMPLKGLTPEQLFDSLVKATGYKESQRQGRGGFGFGFNPNSIRQEFLTKFANHDKRTEHETTILQALTMMNGRFMSDLTNGDKSETFNDIVRKPLTTSQRVESLYLAILSRKPNKEESERLVKYVDDANKDEEDEKIRADNLRSALSDVFWALLNSSEFILNH